MEILTNRFLRYVAFETTSNSESESVPSTKEQMDFALVLAGELKAIGLQEVEVDENGYVMATLPKNTEKQTPTIGFIAHMDTSPDVSGKNVQPKVINNYDGNDIILDPDENIVLSPTLFPELKQYIHQDLIVTNGKTLLGADDKAGIAEIITAMEYLVQHTEIEHGKIRIAFTPDEEIGRGAHKFDVAKFSADWAYTMDGGQIGELEYENFNAAEAAIIIHGTNVHPGYAKGKMVNSLHAAQKFTTLLPTDETPEKTSGYEGFYHLTNINGTVEKTMLHYIIRDHDFAKFEKRKEVLQNCVNAIAKEIGDQNISIEIRDQYRNMHEKIEPDMHIIHLAENAMKAVGVEPVIKPIRGGTDGAQLSFMGLPCPNIFAGGHNFHGKHEFISIQSMQKAVEVIIEICKQTKFY